MRASDEPIKSALESFADDVLNGTWAGRREREAVSLFAFGPLLEEVEPSSFLYDSRQIGLEVPIPQVALEAEENLGGKKNQVCKDLVIWPEPQMTCWDVEGNPTVAPVAVIEWKFGEPSIDQGDVDWLSAFTSKYPDCVGYAVTANPPESAFTLSCTRVTEQELQSEWIHIP